MSGALPLCTGIGQRTVVQRRAGEESGRQSSGTALRMGGVQFRCIKLRIRNLIFEHLDQFGLGIPNKLEKIDPTECTVYPHHKTPLSI